MVTCVRGDGKGRAAARAHRGLSLDGEWGGRESSQARVPVMRDDIDSWSRPRLAERLKVVGLRAHVAGDARPQLTRRGDDDAEEHHGGKAARPCLGSLELAVWAWDGSTAHPIILATQRGQRISKERKKENTQPKGGMGERHAATTQGF